MGFDGRSVVEEGGRVTVTGVPFEPGREVSVRVEPREEWVPASGAEVVADLDRLARGLKERHPDMPVLSDEAMSRESIYEDDGL